MTHPHARELIESHIWHSYLRPRLMAEISSRTDLAIRALGVGGQTETAERAVIEAQAIRQLMERICSDAGIGVSVTHTAEAQFTLPNEAQKGLDTHRADR